METGHQGRVRGRAQRKSTPTSAGPGRSVLGPGGSESQAGQGKGSGGRSDSGDMKDKTDGTQR